MLSMLASRPDPRIVRRRYSRVLRLQYVRDAVAGHDRTVGESSSRSWTRRISLLQLVPAVIVAIAGAVELARLIDLHAAPGVYLGWAAAAAGAVATVWAPWPGLALVAAGPMLSGAFGWNPIVEWSIGVFMVFSVTLRRGRPVLAGLLVGVPAMVGIFLGGGVEAGCSGSFAAVISLAAAGGIGMALRAQRRLRAALEQRAADAQATKEAEAERRVAQERLRIARELHDMLGHEIATVSLQLGIAEVALPEAGSQESRRALEAARGSVRGVLAETQRILAVLREDSRPEPSEPTPGLHELLRLADSFGKAGLDLHARFEMDDVAVTGEVGLAAYRVVQEALTNASRYARGTVSLAVVREGAELVIEVRNQRDNDAVATGGGLGLIGMRERVSTAGGILRIERGGTGFALTVRLPILDGTRS
jgi:signal transduction histidine kinase